MDASASETVVMTATFRAENTPFLVIRDERERALHYLCALVAWARPSRVARIVFGENSNTCFDFSPVVRLLERAGKEVEVLVFDGNRRAPELGKGYGEGEILEYLYRHSRLMRAAPVFYKITGRLFVRNFDRVSESTSSGDAFRFKRRSDRKFGKTITTFFKCSRDLFETRLLDAYRDASDAEGHHIEHLYFQRLMDLDIPDFGRKPLMVGQKASTGRMYDPYDEDIVRTARALL